jgi:hypothetical protein
MIYLVMGSTGEYADHQTWLVMALPTEAEADGFAAQANDWCRQNHVLAPQDGCGHVSHYSTTRAKLRGKHPLDPNFDLDYTGTRYYVERVRSRGLPTSEGIRV